MKFSTDEEIRLNAITKYLCGELHYQDAIAILKVKERQFRRIVKAFRERGLDSFIHGNCGRSPPNKTALKNRNKIIELYRGRYNGLNLVHFREKLEEELDSVPCYSTLRNILLNENLLKVHQKRSKRVHPMRKRYEQEEMMVQIDGSHRRWIFGLSPCCLTLAIDDATGTALAGLFTPEETTFAAMDVAQEIIERFGVFQILYSDRAGIYGGGKRDGFTNMNRAMKEIGSLCIQATTPQAKGRIERAFRTFQDRLVSEFRLNDVTSLEKANRFLKEVFIPDFNKKFSVKAANPLPAYKELPAESNVEEIFTMRDSRVVQSGEVINFLGEKFVVRSTKQRSLEKELIEIREYRDGSRRFFFQNEEVEYEYLDCRLNAA